MKNVRKVVATVVASAGLVFAIFMPSLASAQTSVIGGGGNGIQVAPVRTDVTMDAGTTKTIQVNVTNVTGQTATYQAVINDFTTRPGDETGTPALLLDNNSYAPSHSLKRYVKSIPNFTLAAGATENVTVTITIPKGVAGGGYYGAVRFSPSTVAKTNQTGATLSASVGSLILVRVPGAVKDDLRIASFDVRTSTTATGNSSVYVNSKSLYAVARFENKGNIQEQPFGKVTVMKGKTVIQSTEINPIDTNNQRANVLPDSIRRFSVPLTKLGSWGKYTVRGDFGYGSNGQLLSATTTFYVIPVVLIIIVVVLLGLILFAIFGLPRAIRRYNQRVLRRAGRR